MRFIQFYNNKKRHLDSKINGYQEELTNKEVEISFIKNKILEVKTEIDELNKLNEKMKNLGAENLDLEFVKY